MTTEQKLREAVTDLVAAMGECACHEGYKSRGRKDPQCQYCDNLPEIEDARAALALPPSKTREEWMVRYESQEFYPERWEARESIAGGRAQAEWIIRTVIGDSSLYRNARIESRITFASPWAEVPAGIQPSPQAECAALIGQCMDKLIDAAPFQTICAFGGSKDGQCQKCGKSWMAPDHQAPLFDPRTPR